MSSSVWNKYKILKEIDKNINIKTYLASKELIIKEIISKNINEYIIIRKKLERIKNKIYEIIEEDNKIYIVIENNKEIITEIDKLLLSNEINNKKENIAQGKSISKNEIINLLEMENSMCKIISEKIEDNEKKKGIGFFCEINNFPIKYALFTNNHILNEYNIKIGNTINIEYYEDSKYKNKKIEINDKRRVFINKELDYTCVEINEYDNIKNYFKIDPIIFTNKKNSIINSDIFILQYSKGNELSFSYGKILSLKNNNIIYSSSIKEELYGSPIIRRSKDNYILGLYHNSIEKDKNKYSFNLATVFDCILNDINKNINLCQNKTKLNEIRCIYYPKNNEKEIQLLHDYNLNIKYWREENKKVYLEAKEKNKKIYEENMELYINDKKTKFEYKYRVNEIKEIKVKFIFKINLTNTSYMLFNCSSLNSIDLSSFNTNEVINMSYMFYNCASLKSLDLSSFNTNNATDMSFMFENCYSLNSIDLSSFNTKNVTNMNYMFDNCYSLYSIDLTSFNTNNVIYMYGMFYNCFSLFSLDLSSFNTNNVINMSYMFYNCSSLNSLYLSSFNKNYATDMSFMFENCSSLTKKNIINL